MMPTRRENVFTNNGYGDSVKGKGKGKGKFTMRHLLDAPALGTAVMNRLTRTNWFPSTITFQRMVTQAADSFGQEVKSSDADWVDVPGYVSIPCAKAPEVDYAPRASTETKTPVKTESVDEWRVVLNQYLAGIDKKWRARVDTVIKSTTVSVVYDVTGIENPSHLAYTRVKLKLVSY